MFRSKEKLFELCKSLQLPLNGDICSDTDALVQHIYKKYFENKVAATKQPPTRNGDALNGVLCKCLNNTTGNLLQEHIEPDEEDDVWIFGYGSLIWRPDFPFIDRKQGFIRGYKRLFYQNSIDHRGTPKRPGRVVTLLHDADADSRVYGMAYRISAKHRDEVLAHLDYREKNGYERCDVQFYEYPYQESSDDELRHRHFSIIMYIATPDNTSYAGNDWQIPVIAQQIFTAAGPSGPNRDYLFNLANAMRDLFPDAEDQHLYALEAEVKRLIAAYEPKLLEKALKREIENVLKTGNLDGDVRETVRDVEQLCKECTRHGWREDLLANEFDSLKEL